MALIFFSTSYICKYARNQNEFEYKNVQIKVKWLLSGNIKKRKAFDDVSKFSLKVKYDNVKVQGVGLWEWVGAKNHD